MRKIFRRLSEEEIRSNKERQLELQRKIKKKFSFLRRKKINETVQKKKEEIFYTPLVEEGIKLPVKEETKEPIKVIGESVLKTDITKEDLKEDLETIEPRGGRRSTSFKVLPFDYDDNYKKFERYVKIRYNPTTVKLYTGEYKKFVRIYKNDPKEIGQNEVEDYLLQFYFGDEGNPKSRNPFYRAFIKSYLNCFNIKGVEIPYSLMKNKQLKIEHKFIEIEEVQKIINIQKPSVALILRIFFETGLRLRELINCHRLQIDLPHRTIMSKEYIDNDEFKKMNIGSTGKGNKPFKVKFSPATAIILGQFLAVNKQDFPFHLSKKHAKDNADSFYRHLVRRCKRMGIKKCSPHKFRHALAYYLRSRKGFDLDDIRIKLRHSSTNTTQIYASSTQEHIDDKIDKQVFNNTQPEIKDEKEIKEEVITSLCDVCGGSGSVYNSAEDEEECSRCSGKGSI